MSGPTAVVLHGAVAPDAPPDEQDTLVQVAMVSAALAGIGYVVERLPLSLDLAAADAALRASDLDLVFNLVESVDGTDALLPLGPMLLDRLGLPYTGCSAHALQLTNDKLLAKRLMRSAAIPTPDWLEQAADGAAQPGGRYIVKSVTEHASFGLDETAIVPPGRIADALAGRARRHGGRWFAEAFVDGREFNLSLLAGADGPQVLPAAEIAFDGGRRIVGYAAKWQPASGDYAATPRRTTFSETDLPLLGRLVEIARACWRLFELSGYARVDFRVDPEGRPFVLEVNANPCLSPDAGFMDAARRAGLDFPAVLRRIIADPVLPPPRPR